MRRIALVTGANKGLGFETAQQLAQLGFTVWLGARDEERGRAAVERLASDGDVRFVSIDVTNGDSVRAASVQIGDESGGLDVLVNNAGVGGFPEGEGLPSVVQIETIQRTWEVNFYGALRVTQAFLPLVRKSAGGRIVNVSSGLGSTSALADPRSGMLDFPVFAYASSKTVLNSLTGWLAAELGDSSIKVNSVCPGVNATDINGHLGDQHPSVGAKIIVMAATLDADGPTGTFFDANGPLDW